jgi:glycosyltransferase involved in cell wall biosynthesis
LATRRGYRYDVIAVLNVLTLSTLYPNRAQPNFGSFVERQTLRLASQPGVNLSVIAPIGRLPLPIGPYAALASVPAHDVRGGVDVAYPGFSLIPAIGWRLNPRLVERAVRRALAETGFAPDVIDCEFFWPDAPAAVAIGAALGIPVSLKARGSDIRLWGQRPAARRMMCAAAAAAQGILAVSEALKADMAAMGIPVERVQVHYTGVELDRFGSVDRSAARAALGVTGPLLLAVGNLVALKRHALLVDTMALLPEATLLIAGDGRERQRLQTRIAERGLGNRVRLLGDVPHDDMPTLMAAADVFVHAASSEGLANVWIEALASGTPVVTTSVGGAAEVIDRPAAGCLVDDAAPASFAAAIAAILADPPAPGDVRAAATRFDWATNTRTLRDHLAALTR